MTSNTCAKCGLPIEPSDDININGQHFHTKCCTCCMCQKCHSCPLDFYGCCICPECFEAFTKNHPNLHPNLYPMHPYFWSLFWKMWNLNQNKCFDFMQQPNSSTSWPPFINLMNCGFPFNAGCSGAFSSGFTRCDAGTQSCGCES